MEYNEYNSNTQVSNDNYYYTVRMNEVILASFPMVYFKYIFYIYSIEKIWDKSDNNI